jgi:hypothetical protein
MRNANPGASMRKAFLIFLLPLICSCSHLAKVDLDETDELLLFIRNDQTTRQEIENRLREPHKVFEGGRISTYLIGENDEGYSVVNHYEVAIYHLVLVFGSDEVVKKHSLIQVR